MIGAAREGWRIGASNPVQAWRTGWAGYAEMGAVAWHAIEDLDKQIGCDTWTAMERALRDNRVAPRSAPPALEATSALVRKILEQTGRNRVARGPDTRTLCALEIPARLWRALGEARRRGRTRSRARGSRTDSCAQHARRASTAEPAAIRETMERGPNRSRHANGEERRPP